MDTDEYQAEVRRLRNELAELRAAQGGANLHAIDGGNGRPKRLTLSDIVESLLAAQSKHGGERSAVKLTRNARGDTQIEVIVRTGDSTGIETVDDCAAEANRVYEALSILYPMGAAVRASKGQNDGGEA
jgi:hypothetical protein